MGKKSKRRTDKKKGSHKKAVEDEAISSEDNNGKIYVFETTSCTVNLNSKRLTQDTSDMI